MSRAAGAGASPHVPPGNRPQHFSRLCFFSTLLCPSCPLSLPRFHFRLENKLQLSVELTIDLSDSENIKTSQGGAQDQQTPASLLELHPGWRRAAQLTG